MNEKDVWNEDVQEHKVNKQNRKIVWCIYTIISVIAILLFHNVHNYAYMCYFIGQYAFVMNFVLFSFLCKKGLSTTSMRILAIVGSFVGLGIILWGYYKYHDLAVAKAFTEKVLDVSMPVVFLLLTVMFFFVPIRHLYCRFICKEKVRAVCIKSEVEYSGYYRGFSNDQERYRHSITYQFDYDGNEYTVIENYLVPYKEGPRIGQIKEIYICNTNPDCYWHKEIQQDDKEYIFLSIICFFIFILSILP